MAPAAMEGLANRVAPVVLEPKARSVSAAARPQRVVQKLMAELLQREAQLPLAAQNRQEQAHQPVGLQRRVALHLSEAQLRQGVHLRQGERRQRAVRSLRVEPQQLAGQSPSVAQNRQEEAWQRAGL